MAQISLGPVRYNAAAGAFEARVDIRRKSGTFRYPCEVAGPVSMDPELVRRKLKARAVSMSDSGSDLLSRL